ncbi:hypothetical protein [Bradyrhizobium sp. CCBAU 45321]|uniref:hypothetical protein n=1 Tax=Bradyrhizobium sp. CCBAU 45321 TaxID=1641878 RepID=UPI002303714C|nr:hypothetical protein [Bradyrhizobium sp. CCBAU 45321]
MSRGAQSFKQASFTKMLKGAVKAGFTVHRAKVLADGSVLLDFDETRPSSEAQPPAESNEWDTVR